MYYKHLTYALFSNTPSVLIDSAIINDVLANSMGQPTMSDEDMKMALVSLLHICGQQQEVIDELVDCVNELRKPKPKKLKLWND